MSVSGKINVSALSFDEKMTLLSELAKSLVGQGSSVKTVKTVADAKPKKEKDPNAPKREVPLSFTARTAFIAKIKVSHAERFAEDKAAGIKYLVTAKNIIDENKSDFDAFVSEFIAHHGSSPASNAAAAPAAVSKPASSASSAPAATPKKLTAADLKAKKTATATPPKPATAKPTPAAPKKAPKPAAPVQDESMDRITIFEEDYFRDTKTQALWKVDDEGNQGPFVGYFQAGDEDEPIRYAEHPEDE